MRSEQQGSSRAAEVARQKGDHRRAIRVVGLALFVLLVALPASLWFVAGQLSKAGLRRSLEELAQGGEPLSQAHFDAQARSAPLSPELGDLLDNYGKKPVFAVPGRESGRSVAALFVIGYAPASGSEALAIHVDRLLTPRHYGGPPTGEAELALLRSWLDDIEEARALVTRELDALRYSGSLAPGSSSPGPFFQFAQDFAAVLAVRAHVQIEAGETEEALATISQALRLARALGAPMRVRGLIGSALRISVLTSTLARLDALLAEDPALDVSPLLPLVAEGIAADAMVAALQDERAGLLEAMGLLAGGELVDSNLDLPPLSGFPEERTLSRWDLAHYLDVMAQAIRDLRARRPVTTGPSPPFLGVDFLPGTESLLSTELVRSQTEQTLHLEDEVARLRKLIESRSR